MKSILQKFRRTTNSLSFIPEIDDLRFYAIITVVIFHLNTAFSREIGLEDKGFSLLGGHSNLWTPAWWIVRLDLGVKVFFAISGMVLALPFIRHYLSLGQPVRLLDYFYRRLTRLEPPFVLSLLFFLGVHIFILGETYREIMPNFWIGLFYAHVFVYGFPNPINPVTWSLETEAQFYLIVPLFFAILFYQRNLFYFILVLSLSFAGSVYLRFYITESGFHQLSGSILVYFSNFLIGILFAWLYVKRTDFFLKKDSIWDLIGLLAIVGQFYFYKPQHLWYNNVLFNTNVLLMMIAVFKGNGFNWFFTRPAIYIVGGMCYSIYLLHYAFLHLLVRMTVALQTGMGYKIDLIVQIIICLPFTLLVSAIFYLLIEKPCMNKYWPTQLISLLRLK